jgi:NAD(P)-dependent dehydrogenase (short-subunit alcohol dehydrogenase family)
MSVTPRMSLLSSAARKRPSARRISSSTMRHDLSQPAASGRGRGGVRPRVQGQREIDLPFRAGRGAADAGCRRWRYHQYRLDRRYPSAPWYNVSKGAVNLMSKSLAVEHAPWRIPVNALWSAMSETGLLETFMGNPDTPENRAKVIAGFRSAGCRGRTMSPARRSTSPRAMLPSSPAWNCRSTAAGRSERREEAGP